MLDQPAQVPWAPLEHFKGHKKSVFTHLNHPSQSQNIFFFFFFSLLFLSLNNFLPKKMVKREGKVRESRQESRWEGRKAGRQEGSQAGRQEGRKKQR